MDSKQQFEKLKKALNLDKKATEEKRKSLVDNDNLVSVTPDVLLSSTQKILDVNRGVVEPDERDSFRFKKILTPDKLISERIKLDANQVAKNLMKKVNGRKSLKPIPVNAFDSYVESILIGSALSTPLEEINPMHLVEQQRRITQMGEGGLSSESSISNDAQNVHPHEFGFLDSVAGPECFLGDSQVFTDRGWIDWSEININDKFLTRDTSGNTIFEAAEKLTKEFYSGKLYGFKTKFLSQLTTPSHRNKIFRQNYKNGHKIVISEDLYQTCQFTIQTGGHSPVVYNNNLLFFELPKITKKFNGIGLNCGKLKSFKKIPIKAWAGFLGFYLSEGYCNHGKSSKNSRIKITQSKLVNPDVCLEIEKVLNDCGFNWSYCNKTSDYTISGQQIVEYCLQFGKCDHKFVPDYIFTASPEVREYFLYCLMLGDGRINSSHYTYCTTSKQLALDVEKLLIELGYAVSVSFEKDDRQDRYFGCYIISKHKYNYRAILPKHHLTQNYEGLVYCATLPSTGLLYVKGSQGIGYWSLNSARIGVDTRAAWGTKIGDDGNIYQRFLDKNTGRYIWLSAEDLDGKVVGLPE